MPGDAASWCRSEPPATGVHSDSLTSPGLLASPLDSSPVTGKKQSKNHKEASADKNSSFPTEARRRYITHVHKAKLKSSGNGRH